MSRAPDSPLCDHPMRPRGWMRAWARDARGMTLIELLIVIGIMSLLAGAVASIMLVSLQTYLKGSINAQVQQGGRIAIDRLTRDLRQARRLFSGTAGGFLFTLGCTQISFVLPHVTLVNLSETCSIACPDGALCQSGTCKVYAPDQDPVAGTVPYDGWYMSYYLSSTVSGQTANSNGPYLVRTVWDLTTSTLASTTVASNVTALALSSGGGCPTAASRQVTITLTASQQANTAPNLPAYSQATDTVTEDISLRNQ